MTNGLFVSRRGFLGDDKGGVQICTREFVSAIGAAGVSLTMFPFDGDRPWSTRLKRLIDTSPFVRPFGDGLVGEIGRLAAKTRFDFVFLNQGVLSPIAPHIRPLLPGECKIVVLSHGLESTDMLHTIRLRGRMPLSSRLRPTPSVILGRVMLSEQQSREGVDAVCAISPFDVDLEKWLGTKRVTWIPRMVRPNPLDWRPAGHRLGFVGTLDHAPNLDGLVQILEVMAQDPAEHLRVRVVGGSRSIGAWLQRTFPNAEYVGPLDDPALDAEASSWTAFIHPIFCMPRGCSTKLATAIAWQIPIVTTSEGRRGYVWKDGEIPEADGPADFVRLCRALATDGLAAKVQQNIVRVANSMPSLAEVASQMREFRSGL